MNLNSNVRAGAGDGLLIGTETPRWDGKSAGLDGEAFSFTRALIGSRQNVSPKRLVEPGP